AQGPQARRDAARGDTAAAVRSGRAGRDRRADHRPEHREGVPEGCDREAVRRRRLAQAEAAREAEGRQEADEAARLGRNTAGSLPRRVAGRQEMTNTAGSPLTL